MAVLAEYRDVGPPGYATTAGLRAFEVGQSIMERKQRMKLNEQRQNLEEMEFIAKLPLIQADARLTIEKARSAIATGIQQTNLEARAASEAPVAQGEFFKVMQQDDVTNSEEYGTIDPELDSPEQQAEISARNEQIKKRATQTTLESRATKLASLMAKYSYFKGLKDPGYSGYYDTLEKTYVATNEQLHAFIQYGSLLDRAKITSESVKEARRIGAQASRDVADTNAEARGNSDTAKATNRAQQIIALEAAADMAHDDKDSLLESELRGSIARLNAIPAAKGRRAMPPAVAATLGVPATPAAPSTTTTTPSSPKAGSPEIRLPTVQTPAGPRPLPKGSKTIKLEGKDYPLAVDAKGNRAYYKDGEWVELPAGR